MIIFHLHCQEGHQFEGWFQDHGAFQEQLDQNLIQCPQCGSFQVSQRLSTGGIVRGKDDGGGTPKDPRALLMALRGVIETHFEDVGPQFANTALKIHYGVEEARNIRGTTTESEEQTLKEEGIQFYKIPFPVPSDNTDLQ
jgi:hypothetical protein